VGTPSYRSRASGFAANPNHPKTGANLKMSTLEQRQTILRGLQKDAGHVDPEDVVKAARAEDHPLHDDFEWADEAAAHKYRLQQAARLIRSVRLNVTVRDIPIMCPAYVRDLRTDGRGYRAIMEVRNEEDIARQTVIDAMQRVNGAVRRAKTLAIILGVEDLIARIDELAGAVTSRVRTASDQSEGVA
jgi:hypothetical protein